MGAAQALASVGLPQIQSCLSKKLPYLTCKASTAQLCMAAMQEAGTKLLFSAQLDDLTWCRDLCGSQQLSRWTPGMLP